MTGPVAPRLIGLPRLELAHLDLTRRQALARGLTLLAAATLPAACFGGGDGPKPIKVGRDVCAHCAMLVADLRFVAEIKGGPGDKTLIFDDVGCSVQFAAANPWARRPETKWWVMNWADGTTWLDARAASYRDGAMTPMDNGFVALPPGVGAFDHGAMSAAVVAKTGCVVVPDADGGGAGPTPKHGEKSS